MCCSIKNRMPFQEIHAKIFNISVRKKNHTAKPRTQQAVFKKKSSRYLFSKSVGIHSSSGSRQSDKLKKQDQPWVLFCIVQKNSLKTAMKTSTIEKLKSATSIKKMLLLLLQSFPLQTFMILVLFWAHNHLCAYLCLFVLNLQFITKRESKDSTIHPSEALNKY